MTSGQQLGVVAAIVALALAITALLAACLYLMLPTIGYVWTWARILTLITTVPMFWLLVGILYRLPALASRTATT